jgi:hypothetical protein
VDIAQFEPMIAAAAAAAATLNRGRDRAGAAPESIAAMKARLQTTEGIAAYRRRA